MLSVIKQWTELHALQWTLHICPITNIHRIVLLLDLYGMTDVSHSVCIMDIGNLPTPGLYAEQCDPRDLVSLYLHKDPSVRFQIQCLSEAATRDLSRDTQSLVSCV